MERKVNARWKRMRRASTALYVLAGLAYAVAFAATIASMALVFENTNGSFGYEAFWPTYVSLAVGIALVALSGSLRTQSSLSAYRELLVKERRVAVIARIIGDNPTFTMIWITNFIRQGKLDALYVDTERGVVVVTREEDDALRAEPSAKAPLAAARPAIVRVVCPGCGAAADVPYGQTAECEYCGAAIHGGAGGKEQAT